MYDRKFHDKKLTFTAPSTVWKNDLVMKDRETGTLWSHHSMKAIAGANVNAELPIYPYVLTTWGRWRKLHPDSLVLDKVDPFAAGNPWNAYFDNPDLTGQIGEGNPDERLPGKEIVLTVRDGSQTVAYPLSELKKVPVVDDQLGARPIVAVYDAGKIQSAAVWLRAVDGRTLDFEPAGREDNMQLMVDRQTRTTWRVLDGRAMRGPLAGRSLEQVPSVSGYWFAWATHYPGARIWRAPTATP